MNDLTPTINVSELSIDQVTELEKQLRERKAAAKRSAKHEALEPHYTEYRKAVTVAKAANDDKKRLLVTLKSLGFGKKTSTTTPKVKAVKKSR